MIEIIKNLKTKSNPREISLIYKEELLKGKSLPDLVKYFFGKQKSWGVVIGINSYTKSKGFDPLKYAVSDAKEVESFLTGSLGFSEDRVISLIDKEATRKRIVKLLGDELPFKVSENDRLIVFFSGHGWTRETRKGEKFGYMVPVDGDIKSIHSTCVSMDEVRSVSELIPAKQILFVIDSCYIGIAGIAFKKGKITKETRNQVEQFIKCDSRQIITAGTSDQTVVMGKKWDGHSVYTYYFLEGLKGKADYNKDEVISVRELQVYLEDLVPKDSDQTPQLHYLGIGEGQFVFYLEGVF